MTWYNMIWHFWFILVYFMSILTVLTLTLLQKKKKRINAWTCYVCGKGRYAWLWCLWQADDYFPLEIIAHSNVFWGFRGMRNVCFLVLCLFIHHLSIPAHTLIHKHILVHIQAEPRAWSAGPPKGNRWWITGPSTLLLSPLVPPCLCSGLADPLILPSLVKSSFH